MLKEIYETLLRVFAFSGCVGVVVIIGHIIDSTLKSKVDARQEEVDIARQNFKFQNKELQNCKLYVEESREVITDNVRQLIIPTLYIIKCGDVIQITH